jgi:phospho-N-acetylmuramoyl-pentapeptide-transferase
MFYHLILPLQEYLPFLRIFQYITFRSLYAAITALLFVLIFGKLMINALKKLKFKEDIKKLGPQSHLAKAGTPTMGGIIIIAAILFSIIFWGNFSSLYFVVLVIATVLLGVVGFIDDYMKAVLKRKDGMPARIKFVLQIIIAGGVAVSIYFNPSSAKDASTLFVPFMNEALVDLSWGWIFLAGIVIVGSSNAVNLTDGLDGLAIGSVIIVAVTMAIVAYVTGHMEIANYLQIPNIPDSAELTVFLSALIGASLGFLWFNSNPASVFMGDTGSLAIGGVIGVVAVMIKKEIFLFIVGGVFVMETLSVILQVFSYKTRRKRIFKMAPLHHHFELSGWPEQKVVVRLWIVGIVLAVIGLSTLKIVFNFKKIVN